MLTRHPDQESLVLLLKKKGTGETMGKHLSSEELTHLAQLLLSENARLTTKATIWTAITMLTKTDDEQSWFDLFPRTTLPPELHFFWDTPATSFQSLCRQLVAGEHLDRAAAKQLALSILDPSLPDHEKAICLEALRLKRETLDENLGFFEGLWTAAHHVTADIPVLIDLSLSYDGFSRTPLLVPFCAPLLASVGYPTLVHGTEDLGPKYGLSPAAILKMAGKRSQSLSEAVTALETPTIGWGYVDQSSSNPALHAIKSMRNDMVKRPLLATLEKLLQPIRATEKTYLVTGYTHPPYRPLLATLCDHVVPVSGALIMRGVEGSIQPPMDRRFPVTQWSPSVSEDAFFRAADLGLVERGLPEDMPLDAKSVVNLGVDALCGKPGFVYDNLVLMGVTVLTGLGLMTSSTALTALETALREGHALAHWTYNK